MARRLTLDFLKTESGAGAILAAAAVAAVIMANSRWAGAYFAFVDWPVPVRLGPFAETRSLFAWVRDGLMAIFFLVVGMQVKFEVLRGELSSPRRVALPLLAAVGGVAVPSLIFLAINTGAGGTPRAWPVGTGTDMAFALAALAVAAPRMPSALRVFLLTVALADDLAGVGLVGLLFTPSLDTRALAGAGAALAVLAAASRWRGTPFLFYALGFLVVWASTLASGVSPSVAGIACAMTVPVGARRGGQESVLRYFMDSLHPYVGFAILPLFAFAAAGFSFRALAPADFVAPLPLGLVLALLAGKTLGVFGAAVGAAALGLGRRPPGVTWAEILGVAILCGTGLTMSLFIAAHAFVAAPAQAQARIGVLAGSLASVLIGAAVMVWLQARRTARGEDSAG